MYSCEINEPARKTYEANFEPVTDKDITEVDAGSIPNHDVLAAGFPCQPFSLAGVVKRNSLGQPSGFDSPEGRLFDNILNILREKRPRGFLLENVKHLQSHDGGRTFKVMLRRLHDVGYDVKHAIIDAKTVVPQHRERLFIVGFDREVEFEFPKMKNAKPRLRDILEPDPGSEYVLTPGVWAALKRHKEACRARGAGFGYGIADPDGVTRTLSRRYYKDGSEILINRGRRRIPRMLTPRECARLMGFPRRFKIPVSDTQAYRQFGNAVVVPVVSSIAKEITKTMINGRRRITLMEYAR